MLTSNKNSQLYFAIFNIDKCRVFHKNVSTRKSLITRVVEIGAISTDQHYKANEM